MELETFKTMSLIFKDSWNRRWTEEGLLTEREIANR